MVFDPELLKKRADLIARGIDPYPYSFDRTHAILEVREREEELLGKDVRVAGRLVAYRSKGKMVFADLAGFEGKPLQIVFRRDAFDEATWDAIRRGIDLGDWLGVGGKLFVTKVGELSVDCAELAILAKAVVRVPIPKTKDDRTFFQLSDPEIQARERYLHWIADPAARQVMVVRARAIAAIRRFLDSRGFLEVTTPTLELTYGGAEARPFTTKVHALSGQEVYLRISPELPLKRFIVGGFEKVYTICQNFRNEGIDRSHNPEFTMLEWYEAFTDYEYQMRQFEELVASAVREVNAARRGRDRAGSGDPGDCRVAYQGVELDFTPPWRRVTVAGALRDLGIDVLSMDEGALLEEIARRGLEPPRPSSWGHATALLFSELVEKRIVQPTFVCDYPVEISPLTKRKRGDERLVERFEPVVAGMEIGNAYSELTDPVEQRERLERQRALGTDKEGLAHHPIDEDFLKAVGCGMPPTGGVGLGIDRLVMLLADAHSIRDVIAFPLLRPAGSGAPPAAGGEHP